MPTLEFRGKQIVYAHHLKAPFRTLDVDAEKSLSPEGGGMSLDGNLIIDGDNLHALKALLPRYAGRVDCIYIDPPYNTGNEGWVYNDNVSNPKMQEWLKDKNPVDGEDLERHDKWLCMMWPRLHLLRELLADNGVIFISIDDNEVHHLRAVMDEIFGESNYRNLIIVRRGAKSVQRQFERIDRLNYGCEYVLAYSRDAEFKFDHLKEEAGDQEIGGGSWNNHWRGTSRATMRYSLFGITPETGQWRWKEGRSLAAIQNYEAMLEEVGKTKEEVTDADVDEWAIAQMAVSNGNRKDLLRLSARGKPEHYIYPSRDVYLNNLWTDLKPNGGNQYMELFNKGDFNNPKSKELIMRIINFSLGRKKSGIILDSFAGSGTTAHAVLALNKEDGGDRKFILVECEDYADKTTAERVRRVIRGVPGAKDGNLKEGLGGGFAYCTLGDEISIEKMLAGESLPDYETLARHLIYIATGQSPDSILASAGGDEPFHETGDRLFYLIYEPDLEFLHHADSALNGDRAARIAEQAKAKGKTAVVYAPHKFIGQKELSGMNIVFCGLPYAVEARL